MSVDLQASAVSLCPFSLSPVDHCAALLDTDMTLLLGELCLTIVRPKAWCLNTQLPQTKACYLALPLEDHLSHCLSLSHSNYIRMLLTPPLITCLLAPRQRNWTNSMLRECTLPKNTAASFIWELLPNIPPSCCGLIGKLYGAWSLRSYLEELSPPITLDA